jgi:broad specificity phosphatase PhoE
MKCLITAALAAFTISCSPKTIYIVRHAEKAVQEKGMSSDVPLSNKGQQRAERLKELLLQKNIGFIFSTQTIRTSTTAKPLSDALGIQVEFYNHRDTMDRFAARVETSGKKNVLIVGHSNTVDDLVNKFSQTNTYNDLPDSVYNRLYELKKKGKHKPYTVKQIIFEP